jgi:phage replication O-like protein O
MANPQRENGHIDIANEIAEALARTNLSAYQMRVMWAIWRKTWGWQKMGMGRASGRFEKCLKT